MVDFVDEMEIPSTEDAGAVEAESKGQRIKLLSKDKDGPRWSQEGLQMVKSGKDYI